MDRQKRHAATLLVGAQSLALLTPAYIIYAVPSSAIYHRNVMVLITQIIPYAVCAGLWLPSRNPSASKIVLWLSVLLFAAACLLYVPSLVNPRRGGGDMVGLGYIIVCLVTTTAIVAISLIAWVVVAIRRRVDREAGSDR